MVIWIGIVNKLVEIILVDNGSLVDLIFKETLQSIGWDLSNIQKVRVINLVGFDGKTSQVIIKVTLSAKTHSLTIYSKMMVIGVDSAYNVILGRPWLHDIHLSSDDQVLHVWKNWEDKKWPGLCSFMLYLSYEKKDLWRQITITECRHPQGRSRRASRIYWGGSSG